MDPRTTEMAHEAEPRRESQDERPRAASFDLAAWTAQDQFSMNSEVRDFVGWAHRISQGFAPTEAEWRTINLAAAKLNGGHHHLVPRVPGQLRKILRARNYSDYLNIANPAGD